MRILIVDNPDETRTDAVLLLQEMGHSVVEADSGDNAISVFQMAPPDLILLRAEFEGTDGFAIGKQLRQMTGVHHWIPLIFFCDRIEEAQIEKAIDAGADDFLVRPLNRAVLKFKFHAMQRTAEMRMRMMEAGRNLQQSSEKLASTSRELKQANAELQRLAKVDGLTGISNRRVFDEAIKREWAHAMRQGSPLALIMGDIDHFKGYNDHYGHRGGDECLIAVAKAFAGNVHRATDLAARYGGEEFVLLMAMTPSDGAMIVAENVLESIRKLALPHAQSSAADHVTMSLGVCSVVPQREHSLELLMETADQALYEAKNKGRNQAVLKLIEGTEVAMAEAVAARERDAAMNYGVSPVAVQNP